MLTGPLAVAQEAAFPQALEGMLGRWSFQDAAGERTCTVTLFGEWVIGGYRIDVPETCTDLPVADIASWSVDESNTVILRDVLREPIFRLLEDEDGLFSTSPDEEPGYSLIVIP